MPYESHYKILERLYTSPRTITSRAERLADQRTVIIKTPASPYPSQAQLARFRYGCELQNTFKHPGIASIVDSDLSGAFYYMVLEDTGAMSLAAFLDRQPERRVKVDIFLQLALQITNALGIVHAQHVIHRDLHAGNVLVNPESLRVQITDFDLSSLLSREEASIQPPASTEGVLGFVSPEQTGRMNRSVDYRTDYYTLGVLFYLMLSGRMPFEENSPIALVHAHIARLATPLDQMHTEIPSMLALLVAKLLAKNTDDRYQSTAGLQADLEECQRQWQTQRRINVFPLARSDFSERLQISQKLYGREAEISQLMQAFKRAREGQPQLLTIAGYSGIGKSSLVQEAHKPIAAHGGWYIAGKCQTMTRNIPYAALSEALRQWMQQVLAEPVSAREQHKNQLLQRAGNNARLLIDLHADFALLLGDLPPLPILSSTENRHRMHHVMQQFFTYAAGSLPLVLFLDDLQWADVDTLDLLASIVRQPRQQLLLILAWRDNEVDEGHMALQTVRSLQHILPAMHCQHVLLAPLQETALKLLLIDSLQLHADRQASTEIDALVSLLKEKTDGNPFFVGEFLRRLEHDGLLFVNHERQRWEWDIAKIQASNITDNVVGLMLDKMRRLPTQTQLLLQWASCIGNRFDLAMLASIIGADPTETQRQLWPAIHNGVVLQESSEWNASYATLDRPLPLLESLADQIHYRFLHDRMLQAAYESLPVEMQQQHHRHIARLLLDSYLPSHPGLIFTVAGHFNLSRGLIETASERLALAELNLHAAQQAKAASAWPAAAHHASIVRELLPADAWQTHYALAARTAKLSVEFEFLMGRPELAQQLAEIALNQLLTNIEKAEICFLLMNGFLSREKRDYAIEQGIKGLQFCKINVPPAEFLDQACQQEMEFIVAQTAKQSLATIITYNAPANAEVDIACALIATLTMASYIEGDVPLRDYLGLRSLRLLMDNGANFHRLNTLGYTFPVLLRYGLQEECYPLVKSAIHFADCNADNLSARGQFYLGAGTFTTSYFQPIPSAIELLKKGYRDAMAAGDITTAIGCFSNITFMLFAKGDDLSVISAHVHAVLALMKSQGYLVSAGNQFSRLIDMLQNPDQPNQLEESAYSPHEWKFVNRGSPYGTVQHLRLQWAFWNDDFDAARQQLPLAIQTLVNVPSGGPYIDHPLLEGLISSYDDAKSTTERCQHLRALCDKMCILETYSTFNHEHKLRLLQAEVARLSDDIEGALNHYQAAALIAQRDGFQQYHALTNELLGEYLITKGWTKLADKALRDAYYYYGRWGCIVKQRHLSQRHPWLLESLTTSVFSHEGEYCEPDKRSSGQKTNLQLDLESLLKSVQAISSELRLSTLLENLLQIIQENAGAQTAALVLDNNGILELVARVTPHEAATDENAFLPVAIETQLHVPDELIRYVITSGTPLLMQNVATEAVRFNHAYFEKQKPQSVLCLPIHYRERLTGALYLENNLTPYAFPESRMQLLQMLLAQAAIALENARLFSEVEHFNAELEQKIDLRTAELRAANHELEMFSYSVSHDLRNPLRNISGFVKILMEQHASALNQEGRDLVNRITRNTDKMTQLIVGLLELSKVVRSELLITKVNLSNLAESIAEELRSHYPHLPVEWQCAKNIVVEGDERLLYSALENLLNNAWKYSSKMSHAYIEFGTQKRAGKQEYFVRDHGAGFDMRYADKLFMSFHRLHHEKDFSGTGVGLTTVQRVIHRHGGEIWAESSPGKGATFYFTLGDR